jgi:tetratricopeptide (TPR) repeat protein
MDCRRTLLLLSGLAVGLPGCVHTGPKFPPPNPYAPPPGVSTTQPSKADDRSPGGGIKPATYVAFGTLQCQAALTEEKSATERMAMLQGAAQQFRKALDVNPKYLPAYVGLAKVHEECGQREQAAEVYQKAQAVAPKEPGLWYEQGMFHARGKEWDAALGCLRTAAEHAPDNPAYAKSVGFCLARAGQPEEAVAWLARCTSEAEAHLSVARILRHMHQDEWSRRHAEVALQLNPKYDEARELLAELSGGGGAVQAASHVEPAAPPPPEPLLPRPPEVLPTVLNESAAPAAPAAPAPPAVPTATGNVQVGPEPIY